MIDIAAALVSASSSVILLLGAVHLIYTFSGRKLHPRRTEAAEEMRQSALVITGETTVWRAWIGFNASHSFGAILFGAVYAYLALAHGEVLFGSPFLLGLGLATLVGYVLLAKRYWFSAPYRGISLALGLYLLALIVRWL